MSVNITDVLPEHQTETPDAGDAMQRGIAAAQAGDRTTAYSIFQQVVSQYPNVAEVWIWLGGTSPSLDMAEAAFSRALELDPGNEEASLGLRWVALRRQAGVAGVGGSLDTAPFNDTLAQTGGESASARASVEANTKPRGIFGGLFNRGAAPVPVLMLVGLALILYIAIMIYFLTSVR